MRAFLILALSMFCTQTTVVAQNETDRRIDKSADSERQVAILAQPKSVRPFAWKRGDQVTVGAICRTKGKTRVIGIAPHITLLATRTHRNRVEMILKGDQQSIVKIENAAKISELWFEVMPFREVHTRLIQENIPIDAFLEENKEYRAGNADDWGIGGPGDKLPAPKGDELPTRKWKQNKAVNQSTHSRDN